MSTNSWYQFLKSQKDKAAADDPNLSQKDAQYVPRVYGRSRVKPVLIYTKTGSDTSWYGCTNLENNSWQHYSGTIDAVLAICQAGCTLRGVWKGSKYAGKKLSGGSWIDSGSDVWTALKCLGGRKEGPGGYWEQVNYTTGLVWHSGPLIYTPIEVITAASGTTWGKAMDDEGTWSDLTGPSGSTPPAWAYLTGSSAGMAFAGLSHIRFEGLHLADAGSVLPDIQFLIDGVGSAPDCPPGDAIRDLLLTMFGVAGTDVITDVGPDGTSSSSADAYWDELGDTIRLNCALSSAPLDALTELLQAVNCDLIVSGGKIKILPLGDYSIGSYSPCSSAYSIGSEDISSRDLLRLESLGQPYNIQSVSFRDSERNFETATYTYRDDYDSSQHGRKSADTITNRWITSSAHAKFIAESSVRNSLRNRRKVTVPLTGRYQLLEPGDLLTVQDEVSLPAVTVRIDSIEEDDDYVLEVEATEWSGATHPVDLTPETPTPPPEIESAGDIGANTLAASAADARAALAQISAVRAVRTSTTENFDVLSDDWSLIDSSGGSMAIESGEGESSGGVLRLTGMARPVSATLIPVDPTKTYLVRCRMRQVTDPTSGGGKNFYFGLIGVAADGETIVNRDGSSTWPPTGMYRTSAISRTAGSGWYEASFYYTSRASPGTVAVLDDAGNPGVWHTNVRYVRLVIQSGRDGTDPTVSPGNVTDVDYLEFREAVADINLTADAVQSSNYAEDGDGNPTAGYRLSKVGVAGKFAPSGIQIGKFVLDGVGTAVAGGFAERPSSTILWTAWGVYSITRVDRGATYTPRYVLRITLDSGLGVGLIVATPWRALDTWSIMQAIQHDNGTDGDGRNYVHIGFVTNAGTWIDPDSVNWGVNFLMYYLGDSPI